MFLGNGLAGRPEGRGGFVLDAILLNDDELFLLNQTNCNSSTSVAYLSGSFREPRSDLSHDESML